MEPTREIRITLTDVLDRVLDKGLVINADVVISVAGVPLIAITLRALVAGIETMHAYGVMNDMGGELIRKDGSGMIETGGLCQWK
ncbi:MAG: gas vesicle protein [Deltaproteobacteria bacterium]|nr:gas vesicle protein [Deltaproteobacteria bacterium]